MELKAGSTMPIESEIRAFEDRIAAGEWRVEYFDDDGGLLCHDLRAGRGTARKGLPRCAQRAPADTRLRHREP
jgi:hypothetical protein